MRAVNLPTAAIMGAARRFCLLRGAPCQSMADANAALCLLRSAVALEAATADLTELREANLE